MSFELDKRAATLQVITEQATERSQTSRHVDKTMEKTNETISSVKFTKKDLDKVVSVAAAYRRRQTIIVAPGRKFSVNQ